MFSSIYCVLFFHVKYFSLVTKGVSRCTYWWTDRRYGCSVSIRQFVVLYSFLLNSHCKIIQFHISSGDRGDVGPPGLPVLGAQEQALQLKGDKGDPGLAGLGGFPGPRGMSQHCRYLPFQLFGSCIYSWWPFLLTKSAILVFSVLLFTFEQDLLMAALNFEKTVFVRSSVLWIISHPFLLSKENFG